MTIDMLKTIIKTKLGLDILESVSEESVTLYHDEIEAIPETLLRGMPDPLTINTYGITTTDQQQLIAAVALDENNGPAMLFVLKDQELIYHTRLGQTN